MPLDVLGRTRATIEYTTRPWFERARQTVNIFNSRDCRLKVFDMNLEFLVKASQ
jgi:hypothetical protein